MTRQFLRLTVPINAPLPGGNTEAPSPQNAQRSQRGGLRWG